MGNSLFTACHRRRRSIEKPSSSEVCSSSAISALYDACRKGEIDKVQQLLPSLTLDEINNIESNGSTALHAACYYSHYDIAKLLLDAGASRSIRNRRFRLTPFEEADTDQIRELFYRANSRSSITSNVIDDRFAGLSGHEEWVVASKQAAEWKTNLYKWLKLEQSFIEMITFLEEIYFGEHISRSCLSKHDKDVVEWFFHQAVIKQDVTYIVKAYTSSTQLYSIVNNHLAEYLLCFFRWNYDARHANTLQKSVGYLASIFIYHPDLRSLGYTGLTYRGVKLSQQDLSVYIVRKRLLNKSFLSTTTNRHVAEMFAGIDNSEFVRRNVNHNLIQYITLCIYKINNQNTALNIESISEIASEQEVLIMPLSAFQVKSIKQQLGDDSNVHIEIELEECDHCTNDMSQSTEPISESPGLRIT